MEKQLKKNMLGKTGLEVTEFCLGILPMGPLQANVKPEECMNIISRAVELGVNFIDTAEIYHTQPYLGEVLHGRRNGIVIATKSPAATYDEMAVSVEKSLRELKTDYIDIYHLHSARPSPDVFDKRSGALEYLLEMKRQGVIRAVGISTHNCLTASAAAEHQDIDIIFPLINFRGIGLLEGSVEDMLQAIDKAHRNGKGLYAMKVFAGGNLLPEFGKALHWARAIPGISSLAIGVVTEKELLMDLDIFLERTAPPEKVQGKRLFVFDYLCQGCGSCLEVCHNEALYLLEGKIYVNHDKCLTCGYCSPQCPMFAIRVI